MRIWLVWHTEAELKGIKRLRLANQRNFIISQGQYGNGDVRPTSQANSTSERSVTAERC